MLVGTAAQEKAPEVLHQKIWKPRENGTGERLALGIDLALFGTIPEVYRLTVLVELCLE